MTIVYSYFILTDTNNPDRFRIECTCMKNWRLRLSALKSKFVKLHGFAPLNLHFKHKENEGNGNGNGNGNVNFIFETNYTSYLLEKREFVTPLHALEYRDKLTLERSEKYNDNVPASKFKIIFNGHT